MEIIQENNEKNGVFKALENHAEPGLISYTWAGSDKFIIDHTDVNPDYKGKGVGQKLVLKAVEYARAQNLKIIPLCPFAKSVFDKNTEIKDVLF